MGGFVSKITDSVQNLFGNTIVGNILGYGKKEDPTPAPAAEALPETPSTDTAAAEAKAQVEKKRRGIARNKSVFTSPLGLDAAYKSNVVLKTLTGQ